MGSDRPRSPEKLDRKPANEREITPSDDTKAVSTQNEPVFRGVHLFIERYYLALNGKSLLSDVQVN
jgi:hypothetical protein